MTKKVLGFLFFVGAVLIIVGSVANGTLFSDQGSDAETYGKLLGTLIPVVLYVFSGIFLLSFDNPTQMSYIDGFRKRTKQSSKLVIFFIAYGILLLLTCFGAGASGADNIVLSFIIAIIPYFVPFMVFLVLWTMYAQPHNASKKHFITSNAALNEYLSAGEAFCACSNDNTVLASNKALYFPQLFCVVPFSQISSIELKKDLWMQDVYFNLSNGKKFYVVTKHYDRIQEAMNAHSARQQ